MKKLIKGMPDWVVPLNENFTEIENDKTNILNKIDGVTTQLSEIAYLNIMNKKFDVRGDGVTDDTVAIRNAIAYAKTNKIKEIYFPPNTYLVDGRASGNYNLLDGGFIIDFPVTITLHKNAIIQQKATDQWGYNIFTLKNTSDITIRGGQLIGDLNSHIGTGGEYGFGVYAKLCKNITIDGIYIKNFWGDGILFDVDGTTPLLFNENCVIRNCVIDTVRRNGISLGRAKNCIIENNKIINVGTVQGTQPKAGIDLEGFGGSNDISENISIINNYFENNAQYDINMSCSINHLKISNNVMKPTLQAINISPSTYNFNAVKIIGNYINGKSTAFSGIYLNCLDGNGVEISNNDIINIPMGEGISNAITSPIKDLIIFGNNINTAKYGISLHGLSVNTIVQGNTLKSISETGLYCYGNILDGLVVSNNIISECASNGMNIRCKKGSINANSIKNIQGSGIRLDNVTDSVISNNSLNDFCLSNIVSTGGIFTYSSNVMNNLISNNYFLSSIITKCAIQIISSTAGKPTIVSNNYARYMTNAIDVDANSISINNFTI